MRERNLCKHYKKRILAVFIAATMILPSNFRVSVLGYIQTETKKEAKAAEVITLTDAQVDNIYASTFSSNKEHTKDRVSVHDPSIVVGYEGSDGKVYPEDATGRKKVYYIFGSHVAWAYSYDLINWTTFRNNLSSHSESKKQFEVGYNWSKQGDPDYSLFVEDSNDENGTGNLWAPDVIWNENIGKWCMYMSVNGNHWNSSIALLTSDSLNGDWTYVDTVVYSGFTTGTNNNFAETDFTKVTGEATLDARYEQKNSSGRDFTYTPHAIDACVFYDEDGELWMTYGSWSGGIWMFKLDKKTGLRDMTTKYEYVDNVTDPYMGYKLAGGGMRSGEASYIEYINGRYYLFITYGGLTATGGYNMRVFSSEKVTGPYIDLSGEDARYPTSANAGLNNRTVGTRPMSYYQWNHMDIGFVAQGHNSAFVDTDGKAYLIYHTRFNNGTEWHQVRVHQLFTAEDGGLVTAPFEYAGEDLSKTGYEKSKVVGSYKILYHTSGINYEKLEYVKEQEITLNADGTVSGDYTGTWTMKDNTPYITLRTGNIDYNGVFIEQELEETDLKTMCFTLAGKNDVTMWGYKVPADDVVVAVNTKRLTSIPSTTYGDIELPSGDNLLWGAEVTWSSSNPEILSNTGIVTTPSTDTEVILTATISKGNYCYQRSFNVTVCGDAEEKYDSNAKAYLIASYFENNPQTLAGQDGRLSIDNPYNKNNINALDVSKGVMIQFDVSDVGAMSVLGTIIGFMGDGGNNGRMYFTQGSYLGYNATGGFFDANINNWQLVKDYIGTGGTVQLKFTSTGFSVSVNGKEAYTQSIISGTFDYNNVLTWLQETADKVYLGYGSWWTDSANCSISNLKFYVYNQENYGTGKNPNDPGSGTEPAKPTGVLYEQNYENVSTVNGIWSSINAENALQLILDKDQFGNYFDFSKAATGGSRGAYSSFGIDASELTQDYIIETDVYLDSSSTANGQGVYADSQFAITSGNYTYSNSNANSSVNSNYILKLDSTNSTTWKINNDKTVVIPREWIHIKAEVNVDAKSVHITMTGADFFYEGDAKVDNATNVQGLYILAGRTNGVNHVDNTYVYKTELTKSEDNLSFAINRTSYTANDDITYYDNPFYGQIVSELSIEYTINWMVNAAQNGWDGIFSFYNSQTKGRVSVQTAPFITYNNQNGSYVDLNIPNASDANDIAPSLTKGKEHIVKWKITNNNITMEVNGAKEKFSIGGANYTNSDLLNYISACDKFTLGVGLAETSSWNTELCSVSNIIISAQPSQNSVYIVNDGQNAYGSVLKARVNTNSETVPTYQWYISAAEDGNYTAINGETTIQYIPKASDIGKYIKVKASIDNEEVESKAVLIEKRVLIANVTIKDKTYDTTVDAEVASKELVGIINNDKVTYTVSAEFADANAGESKDVAVLVALDDTWKSCYELKEASFHKVAEIFKAIPAYEIPKLTAIVGNTLADIKLPEGFAFQDPLTTTLEEEKDYTMKVVYTPKDTVNYSIVEDIDVLIHIHIWDTGEVIKEPTCIETGIKEYTCTICKETKTEDIEIIEHDYVGEIIKKPTITETGIKKYTCSICGDTYEEEIDKLPEHEVAGEIVIAEKKWNSFLTEINFDLHKNSQEEITITAEEATEIYYLIATEGNTYSLDKLKELSNEKWIGYDKSKKPTLIKNTKNVIYAKLKDADGNISYISSNGIIEDETVPNITEFNVLTGELTDSSVSLSAEGDEDGTYYFVLCKDSEDDLSDKAGSDLAAAIIAKAKKSGAITAGQMITITEKGLEKATNYNAYIAIRDAAGNASSRVCYFTTAQAMLELTNPTITGSVVYNSDLVADAKNKENLEDYSYQWYRSSSPITADTNISSLELIGKAVRGEYTIQREDIGKYIAVTIALAHETYAGSCRAYTTEPVQPKTVTATVSIKDKEYDGKTDAEISEITLDGIVAKDQGQVTVITGTAIFADAGAGNDKEVIVSNIGLTGKYASCYQLEQSTIKTVGNIIKAKAAPNMPNAENVWNVSRDITKVGTVTLPTDWIWLAEDAEKELPIETIVKATAVYNGKDKGNYEIESVEISIQRSSCVHAETEIRNEKQATCTEAGYSGDTYCKTCEQLVSAGNTIAALGHSFIDYKENGDATCTEDGTKTAKCERCDETKTIISEGSKKGHTIVIDPAVEPSCTAIGKTEGSHCSACGEILEEQKGIAALGHDYTSEVTKKPTVTETGIRTYTCSRCNDSYTEEIPKLPEEEHEHQYTKSITKEPTCTVEGVITYVCSCGDQYTEAIKALGHNYNVVITKPATITETGIKTFTCSRCDDSYTEEIPKLSEGHEHKYTESITKEPTCTEEGVKTFVCDCGEKYTEKIEVLGHDYEAVITKPATVTEAGIKTYTCKRCDKSYTEEIPKLSEEHEHKYTEKVTKEATCTEEGVKTFTCSCGEEYTEAIKALGHDYKSEITKPATVTETGIETFTCSRCNDSYTKEIPKLTQPLPPSGNTGSNGGSSGGTTGTTGNNSNNNTQTNDTNTGDTDNTGTTQKPEDTSNETPSQTITTETKPDGTIVETVKEEQPDGTKVETVTETKPNGTIVSTATETKTDGSVTSTKEIQLEDKSASLFTVVETTANGNVNVNSVIRTGLSDTSDTVNISEELLKDVAEDERLNSIIVEITDTTVNSATKERKKTIVNVNIPSVEGVAVEKVVLTKDSIEAAKNTGKGLVVNVTNGCADKGTINNYKVTIPAKQLAKIDSNIQEINVEIIAEPVTNVSNVSKKNAITKIVNKNKGKEKKTCVVSLASNENVKAGMNVTIPVTDKTKITKGSKVYVYKYNAKTGKLVETANCKKTVSKDGTVTIAASSGKDYVISAKKLSGNKVQTIKDSISMSISKKTAKAGKTINVKISLPDTVSTKSKFGTEKANITYKSSDSKVASVSKSGVITTKKKGTVVVTATVKLASGQKVTKKQEITIK